MLNAPEAFAWGDGLLTLGGLLVIGFLVSWIATDIGRVRRAPYIGVLAVATAAAAAFTVWATDVSVQSFLGHNWQEGLAAGLISGVVVALAIRKFPATLHRSGHELVEAEAWEGVVYGISEGLLLSALPSFVAWQAAADAGWNTVASWAIALAAGAVMIAVHHFGYWDYRNKQVLVVVMGCSILTVAFLASGSVVAPALGHVLMHVGGITKGVELPPHDHIVAMPA